jgi:hypothetical protein
MRIFLGLLIVLLSISSSSQIYAAGMTDGFRSFRWGSEPTSSMYKTDNKANMQGYMAHDEDKNVLGVQADFITYYYFGGGLCRVEIAWWPRKITMFNQIQAGLEKHWGKPSESDGSGGTKIIRWVSESGITSGSLLAMDDAKNNSLWHITIIIQGCECSKSAIDGSGL